MLPFFTLQSIQLETGDLAQKSPELLPADATEPTALFAEVLRVNVDEVDAALPYDGTPLPVGGNPLPASSSPAAIDAAGLAAGTRAAVPAESSSVAGAVRRELPRPGPSLNGPPAAQSAAQLPAGTRMTPLPDAQTGQPFGSPPGREPGNLAQAAEQPRTPQRSPDAGTLGPVPRNPAAGAAPAALYYGPAQNPASARPAADVAASPAAARNDAMVRRDPAYLRQAPRDLRMTDHLEPAPGKALAAAAGDSRPAAPVHAPTSPATAAPAASIVTGEAVPTPQSMPQAPGALSLAPSVAQAAPPNLPAPQLHSAISVAVQEPQWGEQLGERVQLMANSRLQSAEIRLTPAELGPVRVQVAVDDGNATVTFHAQHALTREAIEQAMPRLRELLSESGLTLQQASVAGDEAQQGSREAGDGERNPLAETRTSRDEDAADDDVPGSDAALQRRRPGNGLVDTFA